MQHHTQGRLPEAEGIYQQILQADPNQPVALHLLGVVAHQVGKNDIAVDLISRALAIKPDYAEAHSNLGNALEDLGRLDEAITSYRKALAIKPDYPEAHNNLGNALQSLGRLDEAVASYRKAIAIKPDYLKAHSNLVNAEQYRTGVTLKKLGSIHAVWEKQFGAPLQKEWRDHGNIPDLERRLRIGFVSPDLGRHPVGYFVVSLLEHRQKNEVEFFCYSDPLVSG